MKSKEVSVSRPCVSAFLYGVDRVFIISGISSVIAVWFVWHFIFDLVLQVILGMTALVLWIKNIQLKRHLNKLESRTSVLLDNT